jgi:hypothetical protein
MQPFLNSNHLPSHYTFNSVAQGKYTTKLIDFPGGLMYQFIHQQRKVTIPKNSVDIIFTTVKPTFYIPTFFAFSQILHTFRTVTAKCL